MKQTEFDVLIVGGGTIGCCLALSLASSGKRIAIVEAFDFQSQQHSPGFDGRAIALAWQSRQILSRYGLGEKLEQVLTPIQHIHVSDRGYLGQCSMDHSEYNVDALGHVVELQPMGQVLHQALSQTRVTWFCPRSVKGLKQNQTSVDVELDDGQVLRTGLLVAADGGQSMTRRLLKLPQQVDDYEQVAVIANIGLSQHHQFKAYERFTEHGPLALLPMGEHQNTPRSSLVWTVKPQAVDELLQMSQEQFLQRLQRAFGYRLGRFIQCGERFSYPLKLIQMSQQICHRAVLIGNASHTIHPIAGQGFNLGLRDVECLRQGVLQAWEQGRDHGDYRVLHAYQQQRKTDQQRVITMTDSLVRLFSNQHWPLVAARNLGLSAMAASQCTKGLLAAQAMGNRGELNLG